MDKYVFTEEELIEYGWDGNPGTLYSFKMELYDALSRGWNPKEMTYQQFIEQENEEQKDSIEERRYKAELLGWDEEEMDLEEFEDYFM